MAQLRGRTLPDVPFKTRTGGYGAEKTTIMVQLRGRRGKFRRLELRDWAAEGAGLATMAQDRGGTWEVLLGSTSNLRTPSCRYGDHGASAERNPGISTGW